MNHYNNKGGKKEWGIEMRLISAAVLLVALCGGCATAHQGREFRAENIEQLQPGQTTASEARKLLGKPYQVVTTNTGEKLYIWQYVESRVRGASVSTDVQHLSVLFSPDGRMIRVNQQIQ